MNVMKNFTLRSLSRNKKRTVVTIIGVIISAAMITAVTTFFASFLSLIQRDCIADGGSWHAELKNVPVANISALENSNAVDSATIAREVGCALIDDSSVTSDANMKPYLYIQQYNTAGFSQMSVRLTSGRLPQSSNEIIVSDNIAKGTDKSYNIGDEVTLNVGHRYTPEGALIPDNAYYYYEMDDNGTTTTETFKPEKSVTFTVVGTMEAPSFERSWGAGFGALGYVDPATLSPDDTVNVYLSLSQLDRSLYKTVPSLAEAAGASENQIEYNDELLRYYGVVENDNMYSFIIGFAAVIIIIIIIASISLIYNAFAISVSERTRQLGLLSSVGATRQQKSASVHFEGLFIGCIGIPLGILAGLGGMAVTLAAIQPLLEGFFNTSAGMTLTPVISPVALIADALLSAVTIFISVLIPAKRASRITPIDAIRQTGDIRLTKKAVRTSRLTRALFGFEAEIALKNLKRNRKKYRATVVSLVISLVLFLTVSTYAQMTRTLSGAAYNGANFDIEVNYSHLNDDAERDNLSEQIQALDGITGYTRTASLYGYIPVTTDQLTDYANQYFNQADSGDFTVDILSLDDSSFSEYARAAGVDPADCADVQHPKAILINHGQDYYSSSDGSVTKASGDILKVKAGDTMAFTAGDIPETGQPAASASMELTIGAVTDERPMGTLIQGFAQPTFVVSQAVFQTFVQQLDSEQFSSYVGYSDFMTSGDDVLLEKDLTELNQRVQNSFYIFNIHSAARSEQSVSTFLGVFVYGFITLISLICIANIFNTVSTSIALRRREFAMLRSVGMTPKSFNRMVRFESIFYGLNGLLWGLPLSVFIAWVLYRLQLSVLSSGFTLPWVSYGVAILMILIIVFSTMMYSTHRIKKENIIDALKEENI